MYDKRGAIGIENLGSASRRIVADIDFDARGSRCSDDEIRQIAQMRALGVQCPVFVVVRIEMSAGAFEIWRCALTSRVQVKAVLARLQIVCGHG